MASRIRSWGIPLAIALGVGALGGFVAGGLGRENKPPEVETVLPGAAERLRERALAGGWGSYGQHCDFLRIIGGASPVEMGDLIAAITQEIPKDLGAGELVEIAVAHWAATDPRSLMEAVLRGVPPELNKHCDKIAWRLSADDCLSMLRDLAARQREGHLPVAMLRSGGAPGNRFAGSLARYAARERPKEVLSVLRENPVTQQGTFCWFRLALRTFSEREPEAMIDFVEGSPPDPALSQEIRPAFAALAREDAARAVARMSQLDPKRGHVSEAIKGISLGWGERDEEAMLVWVQSLAESVARDEVVRGTALKRAEDRPDAAIRLWQSLPPAARYVSPGSPLASPVARLAEALPPADALRWTFEDLGGVESAAAADMLLFRRADRYAFGQLQRLAELPGVRRGRTAFVTSWVSRDPAAALAWIAARPGADKGVLYSAAFEAWAANDLAAAWAHASAMPEGAPRARGVKALARSVFHPRMNVPPSGLPEELAVEVARLIEIEEED